MSLRERIVHCEHSAAKKPVTKGSMTFGMPSLWAFPAAADYTILEMAKAAPKSKSAKEALIESVTRMRAEARERMSKDEFRQMEENVHQLANKVRASRGPKRETA